MGLKPRAVKPSLKTDRRAARYLEYRDNKSSKFWEVRVEGTTVTVRFGRIGTSGQTTTNQFSSHAEAESQAASAAARKANKGYQEARKETSLSVPRCLAGWKSDYLANGFAECLRALGSPERYSSGHPWKTCFTAMFGHELSSNLRDYMDAQADAGFPKLSSISTAPTAKNAEWLTAGADQNIFL